MDNLTTVLIGIIFTGLGIYTILSYSKKLKQLRAEGTEVTATIVKITGRRKKRKAYISYTTAGEEIEIQLDHYSNNMRVGDAIKLYVDKANPRVFVSGERTPITVGALFILIGIGLTIIGLYKVLL
jgi:uncharacterized membrane protein